MKLFTFALIGLVGPTLSVTLGQSSAATHAAALDENRGAANFTFFEETGFPSPPAITQSVRRLVRHLGRSIGVSINARRAKKTEKCMCYTRREKLQSLSQANISIWISELQKKLDTCIYEAPTGTPVYFMKRRPDEKTHEDEVTCCGHKHDTFFSNLGWTDYETAENKWYCSPQLDGGNGGNKGALCHVESIKKDVSSNETFVFEAKEFIKEEGSTYVPIKGIHRNVKVVSVKGKNEKAPTYFQTEKNNFKFFVAFITGIEVDGKVKCKKVEYTTQDCPKFEIDDKEWKKFEKYIKQKK